MKVYSISRWAFYGICLLILALPVSRHWKLLTTGERAEGTVMEYTLMIHETKLGDKVLHKANKIRFSAGDSTYTVYGPMDLELEPGRRVNLCYNREDPTEICLVTFSGLYHSQYSVLPVVMLVLWAAFYLSFNNYSKRVRTSRSKDLASSPYGSVKSKRLKK